ncbi:hypothetical protein [Sinorhizobium fredii]|uniref:hypothetical protein n=1 Tax=Rhizobium fredii TaxID=380 RepID=UPI003513B83F
MTQTRTELAEVWPPTAAVAKTAGHERKSPMKAIREKCLDCCSGQPSEVRLCESVKCPLWVFRSGTHPFTAAKMKNRSQEQDFTESEAA